MLLAVHGVCMQATSITGNTLRSWAASATTAARPSPSSTPGGVCVCMHFACYVIRGMHFYVSCTSRSRGWALEQCMQCGRRDLML